MRHRSLFSVKALHCLFGLLALHWTTCVAVEAAHGSTDPHAEAPHGSTNPHVPARAVLVRQQTAHPRKTTRVRTSDEDGATDDAAKVARVAVEADGSLGDRAAGNITATEGQPMRLVRRKTLDAHEQADGVLVEGARSVLVRQQAVHPHKTIRVSASNEADITDSARMMAVEADGSLGSRAMEDINGTDGQQMPLVRRDILDAHEHAEGALVEDGATHIGTIGVTSAGMSEHATSGRRAAVGMRASGKGIALAKLGGLGVVSPVVLLILFLIMCVLAAGSLYIVYKDGPAEARPDTLRKTLIRGGDADGSADPASASVDKTANRVTFHEAPDAAGHARQNLPKAVRTGRRADTSRTAGRRSEVSVAGTELWEDDGSVDENLSGDDIDEDDPWKAGAWQDDALLAASKANRAHVDKVVRAQEEAVQSKGDGDPVGSADPPMESEDKVANQVKSSENPQVPSFLADRRVATDSVGLNGDW